MTRRDVNVHVETLSRVEGEGALHLQVIDGALADLRFEIFEPPRFFEALLRGRGFGEPVDITARICGICPVAYQMSAAAALEQIAGVTVGGALRDLRRLLYAGEWIESHVLHIALLHAPDFVGVDSGIELAASEPDLVRRLLGLKKLGNDIMELLGGRPIHPVNVCVGGFYRTPSTNAIAALAPRLDAAVPVAEELLRWVSGLDVPGLSTDREYVSLRGDGEYPMLGRRLVSDRGLDIDITEFDDEFVETHVAGSTALHARRRDGSVYATGPAARWINNRDLVPDDVAALADEVGADGIVRNPYASIVIRALEVLIAVSEARRIVANYAPPSAPSVPVVPRAGVGWGASEAPRGVLAHRYETGTDGSIAAARIVPPTAQNQDAIEADLRRVVGQWLAGPGDASPNDDRWQQEGQDRLRHRCEFAIRNHDPCISCATHFLTLTIDPPPSERERS
jgi:coenzyme F420-reducing hydrogenase alpha subunit